MQRRGKVLIGFSLGAFAGVVLLFTSTTWFLYTESLKAEEQEVANLARALGERTERIIVEAREMLDAFNKFPMERCSKEHLRAMHEVAVAHPHIRAIGYWRAAERLCGVGFIQGVALRPSRADRIYESGVIAWWPKPETEIGGVQLFLMRYGEHDVAIDPRMLLEAGPMQDRLAGLWVENLRMAATPWNAELPSPDTLSNGLTVDHENYRLVFRYSLGTIFPIDVVAIEPIGRFWSRYESALIIAAMLGLLLAALWIYAISRYSQHRLSLATELRETLKRNKLQTQYQPVVDLITDRCVGAEALARWVREDGETISPDIFIPVAEVAGLVPDITLAVLKTTLSDLGKLLQEFSDLRINLNLAPEDLESEKFGRAMSEYLEQANVPTSAIKLEITERALVNSETSRSLIRAFRQRGHEVAIDDFGTGYSSLSYLESFELDTLKIDKSFVDAIGTDAVTSNVIGHVIDMAKSLGLDTVAEGVETPEQVSWLVEHKVNYGQGYLFSKPLTASKFHDFFRSHRERRRRKRR
ncbi:MAG: EAL domain-containing protein [Gammaproteobacteria bacterium]